MAQMPKPRKARKGANRGGPIVDDQPIVRERLMEFLTREPDLRVCGDMDYPRGAFQLAVVSQPNLITTGLSLKDSHGLDVRLCRQGNFSRHAAIPDTICRRLLLPHLCKDASFPASDDNVIKA